MDKGALNVTDTGNGRLNRNRYRNIFRLLELSKTFELGDELSTFQLGIYHRSDDIHDKFLANMAIASVNQDWTDEREYGQIIQITI